MKSSVKIDEKMMKQLNSRMYKIGLFTTIFSASIMFTYIVVGIGFELIKFNTIIMLCLIFPLAIGALLIYAYFKAISIAKNNNREIEVEFFDDYMESRCLNGEEVIATQKIKYNEIVKVKETDEYLFIYPTMHTFVPIDKKIFSNQELVEIKLLIYKNNPKKG